MDSCATAQVAVSVPGPEQKHVFEEGHRSGIAAIGDRLRAQRPGKTRLQWREVHRQEGEARSCGSPISHL